MPRPCSIPAVTPSAYSKLEIFSNSLNKFPFLYSVNYPTPGVSSTNWPKPATRPSKGTRVAPTATATRRPASETWSPAAVQITPLKWKKYRMSSQWNCPVAANVVSIRPTKRFCHSARKAGWASRPWFGM
jgi:hypothetical protein